MNTQVYASLNDTQAQPMDIANTQVDTALNDTPNTKVYSSYFLGQLMPYHSTFLARTIPGTGLRPLWYFEEYRHIFDNKKPLEIACFGLILDYYSDNLDIWTEIWFKTPKKMISSKIISFADIASLIAFYFLEQHDRNIEETTTYDELTLQKFYFYNPIKQIIPYENWYKIYTKGIKIPKAIKNDFLNGWSFGSWYNRRTNSPIYMNKDILCYDFNSYDLSKNNIPNFNLEDNFSPLKTDLLIVLEK